MSNTYGDGELAPPPYQEEGSTTGRGYEITRDSDFDCGDMRLVLLPKGDENAIVFDRLTANCDVVPLTLMSHRGYGLAPIHEDERDYHGYKYFEMGFSPANSAAEGWYDGTFITLARSTMVLDVSFWKYEKGNTVNFVKPPGSEDPRNHGGGRSFKLESDGTMTCMGSPSFVLGAMKMPRRLRLVKSGSKNAIILENNLFTGDSQLTLRSHPGKALTLGNAGNYHGYLYIEIELGDASNAASASYDGEFVTLEKDNKVLDVSFWKYTEGNTVNFVSAPMCCCFIDTTKHHRHGGRSFTMNSDGTISLMVNPSFVLGVQ